MAEINFGAPQPPADADGPQLLQVPAARYTSPEFMAAERDHLWSNVWLMAGYAFDVAKPGDYFVFEFGDESILVSRDANGQIGAFHNVCMHRGHVLRDPGRGRCASFVCPYHRWDWGLDGKLCHVPMGGEFQSGIPQDRRRLKSVVSRVWGGLVWVCLGEPAISLEEYLGPVRDHVSRYRLDEFLINNDRTLAWGTNWKTAIDGFNETYHLGSVHPQYSDSIDGAKAAWQFADRHSLFIIKLGDRAPSADAGDVREPLAGMLRAAGDDPARYNGRLDEARAVAHRWIRQEALKAGNDLSALSDEQLTDTHEFYVFPNLQIDFHGANDMTVQRYRPHPSDPNRCFYDIVDMARRGSANHKPRPAHRSIAEGQSGAGIVYEQDIERLSRVQRGMRTGRFPGPLISRMERRIAHMHTVLDQYLAEHLPPQLRVTRATTEPLPGKPA